MDIERMIALHLFTEQVQRWASATFLIGLFEEAEEAVPQEWRSEVDAMDNHVEHLLLTAPDWVVGRA